MKLTTRQCREKKAQQKRMAELRQCKVRFAKLATKGLPSSIRPIVFNVLRKSSVAQLQEMMPTRGSLKATLDEITLSFGDEYANALKYDGGEQIKKEMGL